MFKKVKSLLSLLICISVLCTVMPITSYAADAAENVASVTFNGNTEYYTTIDDAWNAAVALDTTAENKATIQLLNDCTAENTLTNTEDYLVLNTNAKTLTTPSALYPETTIRCGIGVDGGSLEIIGNGTITGVSRSDYSRALLLINGGKVYADSITLHNTGLNGSNVVRINGGEFYLLDGQLIADDEYALYVSGGKVYLYSGKLSTTGRMTVVNDENSNIQICYSEKPLYFIDDTNLNWYIIENDSAIHLEDNLVMDLEYSDNPDGSDSKMLRNVTRIDNIANEGKKYLKIQTYKPSYLFSTNYNNQLLNKIRNDKITETSDDAYTAVHFVNLADYDLTDIPYSDYSANGDGSVKAWVTGTELYIGGYEKIIAGKSLFRAFMGGYKINKITGLEMLDTSNVTNMAYMFYACGSESTVFTLDLGDNFDTSKVKDMTYMFCNCGKNSTKFALDLGDNFDTSNVTKMNSMFSGCGYSSPTFTLDLGAKFDTAKVTNMYLMFDCCGFNSTAFTTLDLSTFTVNADTEIGWFANKIPVTKFIFGKGWRNAALPVKYPFANCSSSTPTEIVGATKNLLSYKWTRDNRIVTFTDNITYEIIPITENGGWATEGGTVTGGGTVLDGERITLTATVDEGYSFDGWYDGDTKVCDTAEFVVEDAAEDKTYTAKFTKTIVYYTVSAESGTEGGTVSGGGEVAEGSSITLTATADEGYTFNGWYDGDTRVCDTAEFVVTNVTADKTYTAKFTKNQVDPDPEPSKFDFTSLRTLKTKNITVNHETKTIDIDASDNTDFVTIFVHQKDVIPGGTFKMASYLGNKVVYDKNGSYRIYYVHNFTVPVKANITINGVTEQYSVNVHFDSSKAGFDFTSLKGKNFSDATVNHDDKTVHITANDNTDEIILYVNQHDTVYGGKLRMASYLGNKVNYNNAGGVYTIYANGKNSVSVKANIEINGVTKQYLITVDFPAVSWGFDAVNAENVKNISIDHENKVITIDTTEGADSILLYIDQICRTEIKGQIWMKSYMGNKVVYNAADRTYTIAKKDKNSITVKTKITMLGETRYYDININFTENE